MLRLNVTAGARSVPEISAVQPQFVLRCGSLFLGVEGSPRVASAQHARRLTPREADDMLKRLQRPGAAFVLPWQIEPAAVKGGAQ